MSRKPSLWKRLSGLAFLVLAILAGTPAQAQSLIRDAETELMLQEYSAPLIEAAGLDPDQVKIIILQDDSLNAFVTSDKHIYLFTGLLKAVGAPDELKGVIAHELGHIAGGHHIAQQEAFRQAGGASLISIGLGILAAALGAPAAGIAIISASQSIAERSLLSYTRGQESAADQAGLSFLIKTGQSTAGLISFMDKLRRREVLSTGAKNLYHRTHPASSDRVRAMRERVKASEKQTKPETEQAKTQLAMVQAKLIGFLDPPHKIAHLYPKSDVSAPARYARAVSAFRSNDLQAAHEEMDALLEVQPENPWFHELKGQILFENAQAEASIIPNEKAVTYAPISSSALLRVNLARSLLAVAGFDNIARAKKLLRHAVLLDPENAFAWGQLANAYGALNDQGEAALAIAEQAFILGDMRRANHFARRADAQLPLGSPSDYRALDIVSATEQKLRKDNRSAQRRPRPLSAATPAYSH